MPPPGRSNASRRDSSSGSPKCMKRPPLQVPTAVWPSDRIAPESRMFSSLTAGLKVLSGTPIARMVGIRPLSLAFLMFALVYPGERVRPTSDADHPQARRRAELVRAARHPPGRRCSPGRDAHAAAHRGGLRPAATRPTALRELSADHDVVLRRARTASARPTPTRTWPGCGSSTTRRRTSTAPASATPTSTRRRRGLSRTTTALLQVTRSAATGVTVAVVDSGIDDTHDELHRPDRR